MTTIPDDTGVHGIHHLGREVATTLAINTGVLAFINATQAYHATMMLLQLLLLVASLVYTGFRAAKAYNEWADSRAQRRAREAQQKGPK